MGRGQQIVRSRNSKDARTPGTVVQPASRSSVQMGHEGAHFAVIHQAIQGHGTGHADSVRNNEIRCLLRSRKSWSLCRRGKLARAWRMRRPAELCHSGSGERLDCLLGGQAPNGWRCCPWPAEGFRRAWVLVCISDGSKPGRNRRACSFCVVRKH